VAGFPGPNPFDSIKSAHFWSENVGDHIAGIDQDPIGIGQTLNPRATHARIFQLAHNMIGNRRNMAVRTARSHDDGIGQRTFARQINADHVFCLILIQRSKDHIFEDAGLKTRYIKGFFGDFIAGFVIIKCVGGGQSLGVERL
jgi:hypothetical protein